MHNSLLQALIDMRSGNCENEWSAQPLVLSLLEKFICMPVDSLCWEIQIILLVLIVLQINQEFLHFPLHNYLFIIRDMITYNLGKVNHVTKWFSN